MGLVTMSSDDKGAWDRIRAGDILLLKKVPEIGQLVALCGSALRNIHRQPALSIYAKLHFINELIESRMISFTISSILQNFGFPLDGLVEPGRFRVVFPAGYPKLWNRPMTLYKDPPS
ncbi:MAG: hypothetical protein MN733_43755, partial [Nitrososphaera sp.]|nr:hypothetical protein [Nitrososphaera sp.]